MGLGEKTNPDIIEDSLITSVSGDVHDGVRMGWFSLGGRRRGGGRGRGGQRGEAVIPEGRELSAEVTQLVFLAAEEGHQGALGGEAGGNRGADASVGAGDEAVPGSEGKKGAGHFDGVNCHDLR